MADTTIRSLDDLRSWYGDAGKDLSDEQMMSGFAKVTGADPTQLANAFGYDPGVGSKTRERVSSSIDAYQSSLYGVLGAGARAVGANGVGDWANRQRDSNQFQSDVAAGRAKNLGAVDSYKDVHGVADAADYVAGLGIQSAPAMLEMGAGALTGGIAAPLIYGSRAARLARGAEAVAAAQKAAKVGEVAGAITSDYPIALGDILGNQREAGGEDLGAAALGAVPYVAIDVGTGIGKFIAKGQLPRNTVDLLDRATGAKGAALRAGATGARVGLEEGLGETGQEFINQYSGRMAVNPNATMTDPDAIERYKESFVGGAALGGVMGAGAGGWRRSEHHAGTVDNNPDLLNREGGIPEGPPLQLGYDPTVRGPGTYIAFPDGSVATGPDSELMKRFNLTQEQLDRMRTSDGAPAPAVSPQGDNVQVSPQGDNTLSQRAAIEAAAREFAGRKQLASDMLVDKDENGKPYIQLPPQIVALHHDMVSLVHAGKMDQELYTGLAGALREALQTEDKKAIGAVRSEVNAIKNATPEVKSEQPNVQPPAPVAETAVAGRSDQPGGSVGAVGPVAEPATGPVDGHPAAPGGSVRPVGPVEVAGGGQNAALTPAAPVPVIVKKSRKIAAQNAIAAPAVATSEAAPAAPVEEKPKFKKAPKPGETGQKPATAPRVPAPALSQFNNVPDLVDALVKENKLDPQVGEAYKAYRLGGSHAKIAADLGIGKSTVGDHVRQMQKLVDQASLLRLNASAEDVVADHEHVEAPAEHVDEAPAPGQEHVDENPEETSDLNEEVNTGGTLKDTGDLVDEANRGVDRGDDNHLQGLTVTDNSHGEGQTLAHNDPIADRQARAQRTMSDAVLKTRWDSLTKDMPSKKQQVPFSKLGEGQKLMFEEAIRKGNVKETHLALSETVYSDKLRFSKGSVDGEVQSVGEKSSGKLVLKHYAQIREVLESYWPASMTVLTDKYVKMADDTTRRYTAISGKAQASLMAVLTDLGAEDRYAPLIQHIADDGAVLGFRMFDDPFETGSAEFHPDGSIAISKDLLESGYEAHSTELFLAVLHELVHAADQRIGEVHTGIAGAEATLTDVAHTGVYTNYDWNLHDNSKTKVQVAMGRVADEVFAWYKKQGPGVDKVNAFDQALYPLYMQMAKLAERGWELGKANAEMIDKIARNAATEITPKLAELYAVDSPILKDLPLASEYIAAIVSGEDPVADRHHMLVGYTFLNGDFYDQSAKQQDAGNAGEAHPADHADSADGATAAEAGDRGVHGDVSGNAAQAGPGPVAQGVHGPAGQLGGEGQNRPAPARGLRGSQADVDIRDTPAFRQWFRGSKVVDENGMPKPYYNGSGTDWKVFDPEKSRYKALFLSPSSNLADSFAGMFPTETHAPQVKPLYVRAEHPFDYANSKQVTLVATRAIDNLIAKEGDSGRTYLNSPEGEKLTAMPIDLENRGQAIRALEARLAEGDWLYTEAHEVQDAIKDFGHDAFYVREGGQKNIAVYSANQVKSAIGNNGEFSRTNDDIRYRKGDVSAPPLAEKGGLVNWLKSLTSDKLYRNHPGVLGWLSTEQLATAFPKLTPADAFSKTMQRMGGAASQMMHVSDDIVRTWNGLKKQLGAEKSAAFDDLVNRSTRSQIWPNKALNDKANGHLDVTDPKIRAEHAALQAAWNATPDAYKKLFEATQADHRTRFDRYVAAQRQLVIRTFYPGEGETGVPGRALIDQAAATKKRERSMFLDEHGTSKAAVDTYQSLWEGLDAQAKVSQLVGPYAPQARFGDHIVSYKSPEYTKAEKDLATATAALQEMHRGEARANLDAVEMSIAADTAKLSRATSELRKASLRQDIEDAKADRDRMAAPFEAAKALVESRTAELNALKADRNAYNVEFFENRGEAQTREKQLLEFFKNDGTEVTRTMRDQYLKQQDAITPAYIKRIEDHLTSGLSGANAEEIKRTVREMYLQHLPGTSALKSQLKRRNVPGVKDAEATRSFANKAMRDAYAISRLEHSPDLHDHLQLLRGSDDEDARIVGNELGQRMAQNMTLKTSKLINAATNWTYLSQLGMSPGFMLMQGTQQWVITAPIMAARHGIATTTAGLAKGSVDAGKLLKVSFDKAKTKMNFQVDIPAAIKAKIINESEGRVLKDMFERGRIDITTSHDLGIASNGTNNDALSHAAQMANWPVQQLETMNRVSTALAGFRAERAALIHGGKTVAEAEQRAAAYADRLVSETHMNYNAENRARFLHPNVAGGWGRVMFQFRAYQQGMAYLTIKNLVDGMRGDKQAMKAVGYMAGVQLAAAGAAGLPVPGALVAAAWWLYKEWNDDEDRDLKEMFYQGVKSVGGDDLARLVTGGLPAVAGVNLSQKLGMGNVLDLAPFVNSQGKNAKDTTAAYWLALTAGPAGGQVANYLEAINQANQGDFTKATAAMMPKTVADLARAYGMEQKGMYDKRGNTILTPDDISAADVALRAFGLQSENMQRMQDQRSAYLEARSTRNDLRAKLLASYAKARLAGEDTQTIQEKVGAFNEKHPDDRIVPGQLMVAVSKRREFERNLRNGVPVGKRDKALAQEMGVE